MKIVNIKLTVLLLAITLGFTGTLQASIAWSNASGTSTAGHFDWENGQSDNGLFGNPVVVGNALQFHPQGFNTHATNNDSNTISDILTFDLIAHEDSVITEIQITELGDYGIEGTGSVDVLATLTIQNLSGSGELNTNLLTTPSMPATASTPAECNWSATGNIAIDNWTHLRITLTNTLQATADANSSTYIDKKVVGTPVSITIIPEPATLLFLTGGIVYMRKRKALKT